MAQNLDNINTLKSFPFKVKKLKVLKKKKNSNFKIFTKKPKELSNKQLSDVLPFPPRKKDLKDYPETHDVEVIDNKSLNQSLFLAEKSINDLFRDLLWEKIGFKYNLGAVITLKRWNSSTNTYDIETIFLKAKAITVIRFNLNRAYEELKHRLDIWTGEGSGWIIDKIEEISIDISNYDLLVGSSYIPLPSELNNSVKDLINIKNKDNECFKWCHTRFINSTNSHLERIKKQDKEIAKTLNYRGINFPMKARDCEIIEERFNINVNVFGYENRVFPLYVSKKSNEQVLNVLLISNEEKSHYVFIKDFNRLMYSKTKHKDRKHFCMSCLQNFTTKEILNNHRERGLLINETQVNKTQTQTQV